MYQPKMRQAWAMLVQNPVQERKSREEGFVPLNVPLSPGRANNGSEQSTLVFAVNTSSKMPNLMTCCPLTGFHQSSHTPATKKRKREKDLERYEQHNRMKNKRVEKKQNALDALGLSSVPDAELAPPAEDEVFESLQRECNDLGEENQKFLI